MLFFFISFFLFFLSVDEIWILMRGSIFEWGRRNPIRELNQVIDSLHGLQEMLESGMLPEVQHWARLKALPAPWGEISHQCILELRESGAEVLPTLKRVRELAHFQKETLQKARARASAALGQAGVVLVLIPIFGLVLYWLLPGISRYSLSWTLLVAFASCIGLFGSFWLIKMADRARLAGLSLKQKNWVLFSFLAGERFLSLLRSGRPADLAWVNACSLLGNESQDLKVIWGGSLWDTSLIEVHSKLSHSRAHPALDLIYQLGLGIKRGVHSSLIEGFSCSERIETHLLGMRSTFETLVDRELSLLPNRALKPLYLCVAPSVFLLLGFALWLSWKNMEFT